MNDINKQNCAFCLKKALYRCSCCVVTPYCSMDCQSAHWGVHKKVCSGIGMLSRPLILWTQTVSPPMKVYFEVVIQYLQDFINNQTIAWVIESKHLPIFYRMSPQALPSNSIKCLDNIQKDMLVVNFSDGMYQRARVCQVYTETDRAIIRFLDTGLTKIVPLSTLLQPTTEMERTSALAFHVMLYSEDTISLEKGKKIWIQTLGTKAPNGCYHAVRMPEFFGFPFVPLKGKTKIELLQFFDGNHAALCRAVNGEQITYTDCCDDIETFTSSPGEGTFVLAMHAKQWHRGRLIGWSNEASIPHLVYLFDLGKMCFSKTLKKLPTIFQETVMRAFVIIFGKTCQLDLTASLKLENLSIVADTSAMQTSEIDKYAPSLHCQLYQAENQLGNVQAQNFTGFLESIDLSCWKEIVCDGSVVVIKSFVNEKSIAITPAWTCKYKNLFDGMAHQCVPKAGCSMAEIDDISLAYNLEEECYFRAQYVFYDEDKADDIMEVLDIDTGKFHFVKIYQLRELNRFLRSCPVFLTYIELADVKTLKPISTDSKAFATLKRCCDNTTEFILKYQENCGKKATLFYRNNLKSSLNAELIKLLKGDEVSNNDSVENVSSSTENINDQAAYGDKNTQKFKNPPKNVNSQHFENRKQSLTDEILKHERVAIKGEPTQEKANTSHEILSFEQNLKQTADEEEVVSKGNPLKKFANLIKNIRLENKQDKTVECKPQNKDNFEKLNSSTKGDNHENFTNKSCDKSTEQELQNNQHNKEYVEVKFQRGKSGFRSILRLLQVMNAASEAQEKIEINEGAQNSLSKNEDKVVDDSLDMNRVIKNTANDIRRASELSNQGKKKYIITGSSNAIINTCLEDLEPRKFMVFDLKTNCITEGENVPLLVLDASTLKENYMITAADDTEEKGQRDIRKIIIKVNESAEKIINSAKFYEPRPNEVCLAIFCEDKLWYRAIRLDTETNSDYFVMKFIDFGNVATISKTDIRPITENLMFPIICNRCRIQGLNEAEIARLDQANIDNQVLYCKVKFNHIDDVFDIFINNFDIFF